MAPNRVRILNLKLEFFTSTGWQGQGPELTRARLEANRSIDPISGHRTGGMWWEPLGSVRWMCGGPFSVLGGLSGFLLEIKFALPKQGAVCFVLLHTGLLREFHG